MPPADDLESAFLRPLDDSGVRYADTGGYAAIIYGEPRLTVDVDVVMALGARDVDAIVRAFDPAEYYVPPAEVIAEEMARSASGHFNLLHHDTGLRADVYAAGADALNTEMLASRRRLALGTGEVWVSPPEYVIARKLAYRRDGGPDKHVRDVRAMLAVSGDLMDRALLGELVDRLGVRAQWHEVVGVR